MNADDACCERQECAKGCNSATAIGHRAGICVVEAECFHLRSTAVCGVTQSGQHVSRQSHDDATGQPHLLRGLIENTSVSYLGGHDESHGRICGRRHNNVSNSRLPRSCDPSVRLARAERKSSDPSPWQDYSGFEFKNPRFRAACAILEVLNSSFPFAFVRIRY
jgi:hypothetical protein